MTLGFFLEKNNRKHNAEVCKSDGTHIASFRAEEFDRSKYPEIYDAEEFALTPDEDSRIIGTDDPSRRRFWMHYFSYLYQAEIIRKRYDGEDGTVIVFLEPELYVGEDGEIYRLDDIEKAYQEFGEDGESFEEFYDAAVLDKNGYYTRIL